MTDRVSFQPTAADLVHVTRFHHWHVAMAPRAPRALLKQMLYALLALTTGLLVGVLLSWEGEGDFGGFVVRTLAAMEAARLLIAAALAVALFTLGVPLVRLGLAGRAMERHFEQRKDLHLPYELAWNDEGAVVESGQSRVVIPMENFRFWRGSDQAFLLYQTDAMFNFVMKRAFESEAQLVSFRRWLESHGIPKRVRPHRSIF